MNDENLVEKKTPTQQRRERKKRQIQREKRQNEKEKLEQRKEKESNNSVIVDNKETKPAATSLPTNVEAKIGKPATIIYSKSRPHYYWRSRYGYKRFYGTSRQSSREKGKEAHTKPHPKQATPPMDDTTHTSSTENANNEKHDVVATGIKVQDHSNQGGDNTVESTDC